MAEVQPCLDGVFCGPCSILLPSDSGRDKGVLAQFCFLQIVEGIKGCL